MANRKLISGMNDMVEQLSKVQTDQEKSEQERRKYFLLMKGFKKDGALERPLQVLGMVSNFLKAGLKLQVKIYLMHCWVQDDSVNMQHRRRF